MVTLGTGVLAVAAEMAGGEPCRGKPRRRFAPAADECHLRYDQDASRELNLAVDGVDDGDIRGRCLPNARWNRRQPALAPGAIPFRSAPNVSCRDHKGTHHGFECRPLQYASS
jgi:hypothetical protein